MGDGGEKPALQVIVLVSLPIISPVVRPSSVHEDLYMSFMRPHHSPTHQPYEWIGLSFLSQSLTVLLHFVSGGRRMYAARVCRSRGVNYGCGHETILSKHLGRVFSLALMFHFKENMNFSVLGWVFS